MTIERFCHKIHGPEVSENAGHNQSYHFPHFIFFIREMVRNLGKISIDNLLYLNRSLIWNGIIGTVLNTCNPYPNCIMVPGSSVDSDLSASISVIENKLKRHLIQIQALQTPGRINVK